MRAGVASASRRLCCWTTIRFATGIGLLSEAGSRGSKSVGHEGSSSRLRREGRLSDWVDAHRPRSLRKIGAWLKRTFALSYSRSGLIALLHRLGFDYSKPEAMPRGLDDAKQQAFIDEYENLLNTMGVDEAVAFVDAVHPTHQVRPAGCWVRKDVAVAVEQTTGRERLNIHGAINLETGQTQIIAVEKVNALSFIKLLGGIEATHSAMRLIHVFVDNASYHKADIVKEWLAAAGRKIVLHFLPPYCPHLDPIERLWALMHENVTHNRDFKTFRAFRRAIITFLRYEVPRQGKRFRDRITTISASSIAPIFASRLAGVYNEASKHIFKNSFLRSVGSAL